MGRLSLWVLFGLTLFAVSLNDVHVSADVGPSESECRPYIEKAINELKTGDAGDQDGADSKEDAASTEDTGGEVGSKEDPKNEDSGEQADDGKDSGENADGVETAEVAEDDSGEDAKSKEDDTKENDDDDDDDKKSGETADDTKSGEDDTAENKSGEDDDNKSGEQADEADNNKSEEDDTKENVDDDNKDDGEGADDNKSGEVDSKEAADDDTKEGDQNEESDEEKNDAKTDSEEDKDDDKTEEKHVDSGEDDDTKEDDSKDDDDGDKKSEEKNDDTDDSQEEVEEKVVSRTRRNVEAEPESKEDDKTDESKEDDDADTKEDTKGDDSKEDEKASDEDTKEDTKDDDDDDAEDSKEAPKVDDDDDDSKEDAKPEDGKDSKEDDDDDDDDKSAEDTPEDELLWEGEIPENLRDRKHISELLHIDDSYEDRENAVDRVAEIILRDIKRIYENAIKPLETLYKYRDLSNRHFSDPEIFSKPLILFMGPWSGGKSSIINYLTGNEYTPNSLRTGAEPSPAYFNILMWGNETEVLDGTQLAADYTFSGLQKFGQGLEDRLRGLKLPNKLLEKVNIVEIPGILEVRKQVSRLFPFNDACQWFIDRADIIFLVYDPAKLDVGPETEAILDQLKGREYQTRIVLNKADTVKPEELLRVQSALIWNISPLMSSAQPPLVYTTSLWSHPYESGSPVRLLQAQERAFLRDLRTAVDKRIENKISSARRFAVRVRNHAKMVDCYLNTYYNHKTLFGNKKRIADEIIDNPQNYHIYEGLSTLTNISRYDLPDPEVYRDFFRLNSLYEFKKLSETCTYFRGCPINKLDVAIAYDLPELVGKYKKMVEGALTSLDSTDTNNSKS